MVALASATPIPSSDTSQLLELIAGPSPVKALSSSWSAVGCTVRMIGSPKVLAKSQSLVSCPGTAMIAPVP